jgi:hypothetical protein
MSGLVLRVAICGMGSRPWRILVRVAIGYWPWRSHRVRGGRGVLLERLFPGELAAGASAVVPDQQRIGVRHAPVPRMYARSRATGSSSKSAAGLSITIRPRWSTQADRLPGAPVWRAAPPAGHPCRADPPQPGASRAGGARQGEPGPTIARRPAAAGVGLPGRGPVRGSSVSPPEHNPARRPSSGRSSGNSSRATSLGPGPRRRLAPTVSDSNTERSSGTNPSPSRTRRYSGSR